jgi:hypothetical protein
MSEAGKMNLSLKIAGGGFDDFYPYELTLEEGFSRVYRAELTVFTKTGRQQKDLRELLDRNTSVTVLQRLAGGLVSRNRYVHGIITGVASLGVVSRGEGAVCYRYAVTIESELSRLHHTSVNYPYYRKTPPDIIEEILSRYNIQCEFSNEYVERSSFCKNLMFEQSGVSDLDFISRIIDLYGISWHFIHGKPSQNGLGTAELHFSEGNRFPTLFYEYSDNRKIAETELFDFLNYDEKQNIWKMDGWRMESGVGVEGLELNAPYPEVSYGSREWRWGDVEPGKRYHSRNSLFHGYERGTPHEEIDKDIKRMLEAGHIAFTLDRENWTGVTENIVPSPGLILELKHFYGPQDNTAISALVTDSRLHIRSLWPRDLAAPPSGAEPGELAQVEFHATDWGKDSEKRFCRNGRQGGKKWN